MLLRVVSLLQDVDATAGLTLKVKQEPFSASGELIRGKYRPFLYLSSGCRQKWRGSSCICIVERRKGDAY